MLQIRGVVIAIVSLPGEESITLKGERGIRQCRADAEQIARALVLQGSQAEVEARMVHDGDRLRLLSLRETGQARRVRDDAERSEFSLQRWHDLLVELAK
jgi:hypothetical protein